MTTALYKSIYLLTYLEQPYGDVTWTQSAAHLLAISAAKAFPMEA